MNALAVPPALAAGIMDLNPGLTLWTAITFLLLILVLSKYAFGPIAKTIEDRRDRIQQAITGQSLGFEIDAQPSRQE